MTSFREFQTVAPIGDDTIARYAGRVPDGVAELWRAQGAGLVGDDGFFRVVDPARAEEMIGGVFGLPEGSVVLFTSALADVIIFVNGVYLVVRSRWGVIDVIQDTSFDDLVRALEDPAQRQSAWEWEPYPAARERLGVPGFEQCFGYVPLLALGGAPDPANLQLSGLYEHLAVIAELAGQAQVRRVLELSQPAAAPTGDVDRLAAVGRELFARFAPDAQLELIELPDGLGVCLVHAVRGGGKLFVAPDETALFVGSAVDYDAGLGAFRDGVRTPPEKFDLDRGGDR